MEPKEQKNVKVLIQEMGLPPDFEEGMPFPSVVSKDYRTFPDKTKAEIQHLTGPRPHLFLKALVVAWLTILVMIWLAVTINNIWFSLFAILIIATRQDILGLLIHEQTHCLGFKSKLGDAIANLFAAWPLLLLTVENYAKVHLAHHRFYFTKDDPDYLRKNGKEWNFPLKTSALIQILLSDLLFINLVKQIRGKNSNNDSRIKRPNALPTWVRITYYLFFASLFTYFKLWGIFLIYWLIPLLTVEQVIVRWGAICEHRYNLLSTKVEDSSPIIILSWWEKLLLPNLNFNYHIYHHYYPGICYAYLPKVHAIFQREGALNEENIFYGYYSYFKYLQSSPSE